MECDFQPVIKALFSVIQVLEKVNNWQGQVTEIDFSLKPTKVPSTNIFRHARPNVGW